MKIVLASIAVAAMLGIGSVRFLQPDSLNASPRSVRWTPTRIARLGPNLLRNGNFSRGAERWTSEVGPAPAAAVVEWVEVPAALQRAPGKLARFRVTGVGSEPWHVQVHQSRLDLNEGDEYVLGFWARADRDRPLTLASNIDGGDYHGIGLGKRLMLTREWRKYSARFTAIRTLQGRNRVGFVFGETPGVVELADVCLQRDAGASALRAPHPLVGEWTGRGRSPGKTYHFFLNADGTGSVRLGSRLPADPDPPQKRVRHPFRWYLSRDFSRLNMGSREYEWSLYPARGEERLVLKNGAEIVATLRRPLRRL